MKTLWILAILAFAAALPASQIFCPIHPVASCYNTGSISSSGAHLYHCTCGDDTWVAAAVGEQTRQAIPAVPQTATTGQILQGMQMANENRQPRQSTKNRFEEEQLKKQRKAFEKLSKEQREEYRKSCGASNTGACSESVTR